MDCEAAQELITAWVDNELSAGERVTVEAHLRHCAACRLEFERESVLKRRVRLAGLQITAPSELRRIVEEKNTAATAVKQAWHGWSLRGRWGLLTWRFIEGKTAALAYVKRAWNGWSLGSWLALPTWRRALISAMLVSIVALFIYTRGHDEGESGFATEAFAVHAAILSGKTTLLRAVNLAAMRRELAHAVGDRFKPLVLDLSMMRLHPVAGFVRNIRGRDMLVTVYEGDGPTITCLTFLGSDADAPKDAEQFYDAIMTVNYYSFSRDDLNAVLHQEGDVMCLLVSKMAPSELLALLRGKSAHG